MVEPTAMAGLIVSVISAVGLLGTKLFSSFKTKLRLHTCCLDIDMNNNNGNTAEDDKENKV